MNTVDFKLEYVWREDRVEPNDDQPAWQNKINEILNRYSEICNGIGDAAPYFNKYEPSEDWSTQWIAVYEVQCEFDLPGECHDTEYKIDKETCKITLQYP